VGSEVVTLVTVDVLADGTPTVDIEECEGWGLVVEEEVIGSVIAESWTGISWVVSTGIVVVVDVVVVDVVVVENG